MSYMLVLFKIVNRTLSSTLSRWSYLSCSVLRCSRNDHIHSMLSCLQSRGIFMLPAGRPVGVRLYQQRRGKRGRKENGWMSRTRTRNQRKRYNNRSHRPRPLQVVYPSDPLLHPQTCWRQKPLPIRKRERDAIHLPLLPIRIWQSISYPHPKSQVREHYNLNNRVILHPSPLDSGRLKLDYRSCRFIGHI
jgi:hypothetical protein